jgi:hypothetical protein
MTSKASKIFPALLAVLVVGLGAGQAWADTGIGATSASAHLNFTINLQNSLSLTVGSASVTDTVTFLVDKAPGDGTIAGDKTIPVAAKAVLKNAQNMKLTADSNVALTGTGGTDSIKFDQISITGTGDFTISTVNFSAAAGQQLVTWTNPKKDLSGNFSFIYGNTQYHDADTYTGTVTFTLAAI